MKKNMLPISSAIAGRVRALRLDKGISALELSTRMTNLGYPTSRVSVAQTETGYRKEVSADWIWAAAQSLGVPFKLLYQGPDCDRCKDDPPTGFTCNACGTENI